MVFHCSLSDSKSHQDSRTLLGILAVLNNVIVWMVSTRPIISNSSSPSTNPLMTVPRAPITICIIVIFMVHIFKKFSLQDLGTYPSFHFFSILLSGQQGQQSPQYCKFSFFFFLFVFFLFTNIRPRRRLYLKIPEEFVRLIFQDTCWVVHIPFVCMVKFKFLAQFLIDNLVQPVVSTFIIFQG